MSRRAGSTRRGIAIRLLSACCLLPTAYCLPGCAQESADTPSAGTRALNDPMNYSPDFGKSDKPTRADELKAEAAKADPAQRRRERSAGVAPARNESDWDAMKKDLKNVFDP